MTFRLDYFVIIRMSSKAPQYSLCCFYPQSAACKHHYKCLFISVFVSSLHVLVRVLVCIPRPVLCWQFLNPCTLRLVLLPLTRYALFVPPVFPCVYTFPNHPHVYILCQLPLSLAGTSILLPLCFRFQVSCFMVHAHRDHDRFTHTGFSSVAPC